MADNTEMVSLMENIKEMDIIKMKQKTRSGNEPTWFFLYKLIYSTFINIFAIGESLERIRVLLSPVMVAFAASRERTKV